MQVGYKHKVKKHVHVHSDKENSKKRIKNNYETVHEEFTSKSKAIMT